MDVYTSMRGEREDCIQTVYLIVVLPCIRAGIPWGQRPVGHTKHPAILYKMALKALVRVFLILFPWKLSVACNLMQKVCN